MYISSIAAKAIKHTVSKFGKVSLGSGTDKIVVSIGGE